MLFNFKQQDLTAYPSGAFIGTIMACDEIEMTDNKSGRTTSKLKWVMSVQFSQDPFADDALANLDMNYYTGFDYGPANANLTKIINALAGGPVEESKLPSSEKLIGKKLLVLVQAATEKGSFPKIVGLEPVPKGG